MFIDKKVFGLGCLGGGVYVGVFGVGVFGWECLGGGVYVGVFGLGVFGWGCLGGGVWVGDLIFIYILLVPC